MTYLDTRMAASAIFLMSFGFISAAVSCIMLGVTVSTTQMFVISALAFGLVVVVLLSPLSSPIRAFMSIAVCCAAVVLFASQDLFGLRGVRHSYAGATTAQSLPEAPLSVEAPRPTVDRSQVRIASPDNSVSHEFLDTLNETIAQDQARITSGIELDGEVRATPSHADYRFTWAIARNGSKVWCGVMTSPASSVVATRNAFVEAVQGAVRRSTPDRLVCL